MSGAEPPLLIVADDYDLARNYAHDHQLGREGVGWRYVYSVRQVQGMHSGRYVAVTYATAWARDLDARGKVVEYLRAHGFEHA